MPEIAFVIPRGGDELALRDLSRTLAYELELQQVVCSEHLGDFPELAEQRVYVLLNPSSYVRSEGGLGALPDDARFRRTVVICTEPDALERLAGDDDGLLRRAGAVFVTDQRAVVALEREGVRTRLLRAGYSKPLDCFDPAADRPVDVAFLGSANDRQQAVLDELRTVLAGRECRFVDIADPGDRRSLLCRSKVVVSVHADADRGRIDWSLCVDAIHSGAVVVSEHASGIAPFVPGDHLLVASARSLPFVTAALLRDEQRLAEMRTRAYERLAGWLPYALPVSVLRAAVVELVGEPVPPGTPIVAADRSLSRTAPG